MRLDSAPDVLTVEEARSILRVGRNQMYAAIRAGEIESFRVRGAIRIPRAALVEMCGAGSDAAAENDDGKGVVPLRRAQ